MNILKRGYQAVVRWVVIGIGKIHWGYRDGLTDDELATVKKALIENYYIIVTHRNNHLSTYFVTLANFILTGKWSYWAHALMNLEDEVNDKTDFRLVEATGDGVHYSPFDLVFQVHGVALLKPKNMSTDHWTTVLDRAKVELGKPYDTLFNIAQDNELSCVELVRAALMAEPNYATDFAEFEKMITEHHNLTPQMFYDCPDFEVVYEVRHSRTVDL